MKKLIIITGSLGVAILLAYISINVFTKSRLDYVKEKVIENNPEITNVEKINSTGKWGEWFTEYVLVVEISGLKYRIWTSDDGKITYEEPL